MQSLRNAQPRRTKLPEPLWKAAVEVARQHGVFSVAHPLRLDYMRLNQRLGGVSSRRMKTPNPAFVELVTPRSAALEDCIIKECQPWPLGFLIDFARVFRAADTPDTISMTCRPSLAAPSRTNLVYRPASTSSNDSAVSACAAVTLQCP